MTGPLRRPYDPFKRALDLCAAGTGLLLLAPLVLAVGVLVLAVHGRPVLFRQLRTGRNGAAFTLVKYRTMRTVDSARERVSDRSRLTRLGRTLRATSLDELPSLWNVILGHMSLVGPRPLLPRYLDRYTPEQARRHEVRPGITGLAQVSGRNALSWPERFAYDVWYVDHRGPMLDIRILLRTGWTVVSRRGVCAPGSTTAHEFLPAGPPLVSHGRQEST